MTAAPALSPSRAGDFRTCPLLYRYKAIDRLPEESGGAAMRGTWVHAVLEGLMALPPADRTWEAAVEIGRLWLENAPDSDVAQLTEEDIDAGVACLRRYGKLEDPRGVPIWATEQRFDAQTAKGTPIRGFIDRVDRAPGGQVRLVDYKTGKLPAERYQAKALFQMKLYALAWWLIHGELPSRLVLYYLGEPSGSIVLDLTDPSELTGHAGVLDSMWAAILRLGETGDFRPRTGPLCAWCPFQEHCPAQGGTLLPYPGWPQTQESPTTRGDR